MSRNFLLYVVLKVNLEQSIICYSVLYLQILAAAIQLFRSPDSGTEDMKTVIQVERLINFNRLITKFAYVKRALSKAKLATKLISIEEKESGKSIILKLVQQEQFAEEMKSLNAGKEIPKCSKKLQLSFIEQ